MTSTDAKHHRISKDLKKKKTMVSRERIQKGDKNCIELQRMKIILGKKKSQDILFNCDVII